MKRVFIEVIYEGQKLAVNVDHIGAVWDSRASGGNIQTQILVLGHLYVVECDYDTIIQKLAQAGTEFK
jgi:hypothetical protein